MDIRHSARILLRRFFGCVLLATTTAFAAGLASQSSDEGGVTIAVKPEVVSSGAATWTFQVSLDARGADLSDDLVRTAYLVDRATKSNVKPTAWDGDAPGGRHRKGVLRFKALAPAPKAIELRIQRPGEKAPRMFRWDLDCPCNDPKMHAS